MTKLPSNQTPLNQHSLDALEYWFKELGAEQLSTDKSLWTLSNEFWKTEIILQKDDLKIVWFHNEKTTQCILSYR